MKAMRDRTASRGTPKRRIAPGPPDPDPEHGPGDYISRLANPMSRFLPRPHALPNTSSEIPLSLATLVAEHVALPQVVDDPVHAVLD